MRLFFYIMSLNSIKRRLNTPNDIKNLFNDYSLSISGLMTGATSNAKILKNLTAAMPPAVILHHLPDKQINAVINSDNAADTINRQYIAELSDLSKKFNLTNNIDYYCYSIQDFKGEKDIKYENIPHLCDKFNIKKNLINPIYLS